MGGKEFLASAVTAFSMSFTGAADGAEVIDNQKYAGNVANYLTDNCPTTLEENTPEGIKTCFVETVNATYSIASDLSSYIKDVATPILPSESGKAQVDLLANCEVPINNITGKNYDTLQNFTDAAFIVSANCIDSIRRAEDDVGIQFQPTAVNTLANHLNKLKGLTR